MTIQRVICQRQPVFLCNRVSNSSKNIVVIREISSDAYKSDDYQYLQKGQIPMLHFQRSLPRLKIPELEKTCNRFLAAVQPLSQNKAAFDNFIKIVEQFRTTGNGPQLQKLLREYDQKNKHTSYISKPWFDMYLSDRKPLPINYNPALVMKLDERPEYNDQLTRTANLVITSLRFARSLREELLEPEVYHMNPKKSDTQIYRNVLSRTPALVATLVSWAFKAFPLDMSQYQGLFGATRVPKRGQDEIKRTEKTSHIVVMRNGHFYAVKVFDNDGNIEVPRTIVNRLKFVLNDAASSKPAEFPLGVMTAENRDTWADVREHLMKTHNESALDTIDSALFLVSLDDKADYPAENPVPIVQNMLHGDANGLINRWFDKSFSLIVCKDGNAGINFEHSWGDGVAVLRYFNEIYKETTTNPICQPSDVHSDRVEDVGDDIFKIEFNLDDKSKAAIKKAQQNYVNTVNSLEMHTMINDVMTKSFCKNHKVSPDAIMQLGIQLAYYQQNGEYVGTYESCSTAAFRHGRTETIRPCTMDTKLFCDATSGKVDVWDRNTLREMIIKASDTHGKLIKEAAMGQGFDRHMFGLKYMAEQNNIPLDPIFESDGYRKLNYNILSTSSLSSDGLLAGSFGPVVPDGYGIGYGVQDKMLGVIFTSYKGKRDAIDFVDCLNASFETIERVLEFKK
ncbi:carnitine O-palmitoyltransferase 2, mitochondrial [Contarinia nasturtii]|uniref:carnitine O-palmitoyltransferase 2, mitochondrial n=1 Tax=Contarinia nasturtii TaxID=265458 RepID=UPI0012D39C21|nr:carnitine O-palmitoyltransferase 2, mitochondrial [Contarinia nasturtii]